MIWLAYALAAAAAVRTAADWLNLREARKAWLPPEFQGVLDEKRFRKSQEYLGAQTRFGMVARLCWLLATLIFLLGRGFPVLDHWARGFGYGPILTGLLYFLGLSALSEALSLPFTWYHGFRLEKSFGFHRSTYATFFADHIKAWLLGIVLGGFLLGAVFWFFSAAGGRAWLYAWGFLALMQILLSFLAPALLMPLFNRFDRLPEGELKAAIEKYAAQERVRLKGIFTMDGSKRSSKANAFFTGFGRFRRIVLFDTLVAKHPVSELVAVLAHEIGHMKLRHILKQILLSLASSFVMFWALSEILAAEGLQRAFGFASPSMHAGFTVAGLIYSPLSLMVGIFVHALTRRYEYQADAFAARTTGSPESLVAALKRLSADNLSNLAPHPWKIWLEYSHPPVRERLRALSTLVRAR